MKHVLKELIPFAQIVDDYANETLFLLRFTVKNPINDTFVPHLESRFDEVSKQLDVKEMIEGNAREYLQSVGEGKLAKQLTPNGKRPVSVITIAGSTYIVFEEIDRELSPTKILSFSESNGMWSLFGASRESKQELDRFTRLFMKMSKKYYLNRGETISSFQFSSRGTTWLEKGILAKEELRKALRALYKKIGCDQKEYPHKPIREEGVFFLEQKEDPLFPQSGCWGDRGYIPYTAASVKNILATAQEFFAEKGIETEVENSTTLYGKNIFGVPYKLTEIKKERLKEGLYARITLFYSLERVHALILEKE